MTSIIDEPTLRLLQHPALETPKVRAGRSVVEFLADANAAFFAVIEQFRGHVGERLQDESRQYWMRELASSVVAAVDLTLRGRHERAWSLMEDILDEHLGTLQLMSVRHAGTVIGSQSWYRLTTWEGAQTRRDVFHRPFQQRSPGYRYSETGHPALYLGNNVYLCWLECNSPPLSRCKVSRFEIDRQGLSFLDLPANHRAYVDPLDTVRALASLANLDPRRSQNSPYLDDIDRELVEYLSLWPLLMACSLQKDPQAPDAAPEHAASQLLARWAVKRDRWHGIRYFTTKSDDSGGSHDISINAVLPTRTSGKSEGFCDFLAQRVRCTVPQSFDDVLGTSDRELFTQAAADRRHHALGRYMVQWNGSLWEYQHTPFGRMEYWLDRDDLPARSIEDA